VEPYARQGCLGEEGMEPAPQESVRSIGLPITSVPTMLLTLREVAHVLVEAAALLVQLTSNSQPPASRRASEGLKAAQEGTFGEPNSARKFLCMAVGPLY
jgi:hypothetical protein